MALQLEYTSPHGATVPNAYARITQYRGNKEIVVVTVSINASEEARVAGLEQLDIFRFECPAPTSDMLPALYEQLKTFPDFRNGLDV